MKKKTVALFLTLGLILSSVLTGCGDQDSEGSSTAGNTGSSSQSSVGGESSQEGTEQSGGIENDREEITVKMMVTEPVTQEMPETFPLLDAIKEKFNINLQLTIVPGADYGTKKATVLGTANMPDVVCGMTVDEVKQYGTSGMFLNLDEYKSYAPDYFGLVDGDDRAIETNKMRVNGQLYCF